jgi:ABC-type multidrug transport system permease subunit
VDIQLYDREHGEQMVGSFAFLLSRRLAKLVTEDFIVPFLFSAIFYFMVGFDHNAIQFFTFFAVVLLSQYINITFATMAVSITRNFSEAVLIGNLWYTVQSMACGFFIQAGTMPVYVRWTKYLSYIVGLSIGQKKAYS